MYGLKNKQCASHHRSIEMTGAYDGGFAAQTHGLIAGTRVASNLGWCVIDALEIGDMVLTFDNGMQEITEIRRSAMWRDAPSTPPALWPVIVPVGALDNRSELTLVADQGVLVESDAACDLYGDPFAMIPAHALTGIRGIRRAAPVQQFELIVIYFEDEQVIYAEGGALIHCPRGASALDILLEVKPVFYDVLNTCDAGFIAQNLMMEDQIMMTAGQVGEQRVAHC